MHQFCRKLFVSICLMAWSCSGSEYVFQDVGTGLSGATEMLPSNGYKVTAGGSDIWGTSDSFRIGFQVVSGDFDIRARIAELGPTDAWAKAGLMARTSLAPNASHAMIVATSAQGFAFQYRAAPGAGSNHITGTSTHYPFSWVRLIRIGGTLAGYTSVDAQGDEWAFVGSTEGDAAAPLYVGMCVTAHNNSLLTTAVFDSVVLSPVVQPVYGHGTGLSARYFNNTSLTESPASFQTDNGVNFNWGSGAPVNGVSADNFSVNWSGYIEAQYSEDYTFYTVSDDGVRVWIDGNLVIDNWTDHGSTENRSYPVALTAGHKHSIVMEYYEKSGGAVASLSWSSRSTFKGTVPGSQLYPEDIPALIGDGIGLKGEYFATSELANRTLLRLDPVVNFGWGSASPGNTVPVDHFSARWTGQILAPHSGLYTFFTQSDDGVRLWIDNTLIINNWSDHASTENKGSIALSANKTYAIRLEFYENGGQAEARLAWSCAAQSKVIVPASQLRPGNGQGFFAEYFDNSDFTNPVLHRIDPAINFNWGSAAPHAALGADTFSVRWTGQLEAVFSEAYTFHTFSDDGVRLWVNGQLVIDNWTLHGETQNSSNPVALSAGQPVDIKMEFFENGGDAVAKLFWSSASQPLQPIPASQVQPQRGLLVNIPTSSAISPVCIRGRSIAPTGEAMNVLCKRDGSANAVLAIDDRYFYSNVALNESAPVTINIQDSVSGIEQQNSVVWTATDLAQRSFSTDFIAIRPGDALKLTATGNAGETLEIDADGNGLFESTGVANQAFKFQYAQAGEYIAQARVNGLSVGSLLVRVVQVSFKTPIACEIGFTRGTAVNASSPTEVRFESTNPDSVRVGAPIISSWNAVRIPLTTLAHGTPSLVATVGDAVAAVAPLTVFQLDVDDRQYLVVNAETGEGVTALRMKPFVPGLSFKFAMFAGKSTFDDGSAQKEITSADFTLVTTDAGEVAEYDLLCLVPSDSISQCFSIRVYQSGEDLEEVNLQAVNQTKCFFDVTKVTLIRGTSDTVTITGSPKNKEAHEKHKKDHPVELFRAAGTKDMTLESDPLDCRKQLSWDRKATAGLTADLGNYDIKIHKTPFRSKVVVVQECVFDIAAKTSRDPLYIKWPDEKVTVTLTLKTKGREGPHTLTISSGSYTDSAEIQCPDKVGGTVSADFKSFPMIAGDYTVKILTSTKEKAFTVVTRMPLNKGIDALPDPVGEANYSLGVAVDGAGTVSAENVINAGPNAQTWKTTIKQKFKATYTNNGNNIPTDAWPAAERGKAPPDEVAKWTRLIQVVTDHENGHQTTAQAVATAAGSNEIVGIGTNATPADRNTAITESNRIATASVNAQRDAFLAFIKAADVAAQAIYHLLVGATINVDEYKIEGRD